MLFRICKLWWRRWLLLIILNDLHLLFFLQLRAALLPRLSLSASEPRSSLLQHPGVNPFPYPFRHFIGTSFRIRIHLFRILIQHFMRHTDPYRIHSRFRVLMTAEIFVVDIFWSKIAIYPTMYLSQGFLKGHPSYRRSLPTSKENIKHFKAWNFLTFFSIFLRVIFCPPGSGSRFTDLTESASNPDPYPDSKHW
jgi:hypothetical protein